MNKKFKKLIIIGIAAIFCLTASYAGAANYSGKNINAKLDTS